MTIKITKKEGKKGRKRDYNQEVRGKMQKVYLMNTAILCTAITSAQKLYIYVRISELWRLKWTEPAWLFLNNLITISPSPTKHLHELTGFPFNLGKGSCLLKTTTLLLCAKYPFTRFLCINMATIHSTYSSKEKANLINWSCKTISQKESPINARNWKDMGEKISTSSTSMSISSHFSAFTITSNFIWWALLGSFCFWIM